MGEVSVPPTRTVAPVSPGGLISARTLIWAFHMALPLLGLWLLLVRPELDVVWEDHPAHFWLVLGVAVVNVALSWLINRAAEQRSDARLYLVSLAFLSAAGFLALHALATPRVLLGGPNGGFATASPVGLFLASAFAAASALELSGSRAAAVIRRRSLLRGVLIAFLAAWAVVSLLNLPPLDRPMPAEQATGVLTGLVLAGLALYGAAALGYYRLYRRRPAVMLIGLITAFVLLAEAMVATVVGRNWHVSWWEWHVLMALGFGFVAYSAHVQYEREGSVTSLFRSISLEQTIREIRDEYAAALESLVAAIQRRADTGSGEPLGPVTARLAGGFGLTEGQAEVLERAAEALAGERDQIRRLRRLVAIGQEARVIVDEDELLDRALAHIREAFGRDIVRVGLLREGRLAYPAASAAPDGSPGQQDDAGSERARSTAGATPDSAGRTGRDSGTAAGDLAGGAAEDFSGRVAEDPAIAETLRELRPTVRHLDRDGSLIALPVTVKSRAAGVLTVERGSGEFAERELSILESLASQLSVALENARLYRQIDRLFRQYLSPDVATALLADPDQAALGGAVVEVTVLFADLRGFTPFSERSSPEQVVTMLNRYFGAVVPIVIAEGGTIAQFIGDAIMALFNAPARQPDHALRAARAALAMQSSVDEIAAGQEGWPRFRIGINTGPALIGNIGSEEMRNFTAIGDTTNLAARLQTSAQAGEIVIGAGTYALIRDVAVVRPLAPLKVKGKEAPIQAYVLTGLRAGAGRIDPDRRPVSASGG